MGGLSEDNSTWKNIRFSKKAVMPMWRTRIVSLIREARKENKVQITDACIEVQYHKKWNVHFAIHKTNENIDFSTTY